MTRQERAKQFMPFDAMKGLQEALRDREERHNRVERRELSEEMMDKLSNEIVRLEIGMGVCIEHYKAFHDVISRGKITHVDLVYKYLVMGNEKIYFNDIYDLKIIEM